MCMGAMILARIDRLVYGAPEPKTGACGSIVDIANLKKLNHRVKIMKDILAEEGGAFLKEFFKKKRINKIYNCKK